MTTLRSAARVRATWALLAAMTVAMFVPASAHAAWMPTAPVRGAAVAPGTFPFSFTLDCPAGYRCGQSGSSTGPTFENLEQGSVRITYGTSPTPIPASDGLDFDDFDPGYSTTAGGFTASSSPARNSVALLTAGTYFWRMAWFQCRLDDAGASTCERAYSPTASFVVRTVVNANKGFLPTATATRDIRPNMAKWYFSGGCNGPTSSYAVTLRIEHKVGRRWVLVSAPRVRLEARPDLTYCAATYYWRRPANVTGTVRGTFVFTSTRSVRPVMPVYRVATAPANVYTIIG